MVTKTAFLSQTYTARNHVPSVDLGAFDIDVDPKHGRLDITTRIHLTTQSGGLQNQLVKFGEQFAKLVPKVWDKSAKFVCTERGFEGIELQPHFEIQVVGLNNAHYLIKILDETESGHLDGDGPNAVVKPILYDGGGADPDFAPRLGEFGAQSNIKSGEIKPYRQNIIYQLAAGTLIAMTKSPTQDPVARQRLGKYAREIMALKVPRNFKSSRRPTLTVRGCGPGDRRKAAADAAMWLCACGVKNPITRAEDGDTTKVAGVELTFDKVELRTMFPVKNAGQKSLFQQITVAHEFGHMLGLPDEYLCMSPLTADAMQNVYAMTAPQVQSFDGRSGISIADVRVLNDGTKNVPHIVGHQAAFIPLCHRAGVLPPEFGSSTTSLMSTGMVFHPHHFATLWEAVVQTTGIDKWRIVLA